MTCLLQQHLPATPFNKVVEFGCGTGNYSRLLYHTLQPKQFFLNDLCNGMQACCHDLLDQGAIFLTGDAETLDFPEADLLLYPTMVRKSGKFLPPLPPPPKQEWLPRNHHFWAGKHERNTQRDRTRTSLPLAFGTRSSTHPSLQPHSFGRGKTASFFSLPPASALPSERDRSDGNRKTALDPARAKPFL